MWVVRYAAVLAVLLASTAFADPTADARAVADAFGKAVAAGDADAVIALYADDARVVWPGAGEAATGKAAIAALVRRELPALQKAEPTLVSLDAEPVAPGVLVVVGRWEQGSPGERSEVRITEVLVRRDGAWKYLVDHASVGAGPPPSRARRDDRRHRRER